MSTPMMMTNCPDDNTLAAYIDGRLDAEARRKVERHLSTCEDCYANVSAVWDYQAESGANVVKGRFGSAKWIWVAAAACLAIVVALPQFREWVAFQRTGGMSAVIDAQKSLEKRPMEGRLAGFAHKPWKSPTRGPGDKPVDFEQVPMLVAADKLKNADSPRELRALAAALLFVDERDQAINALDRAARLAPRDPAVLNDLVVAYLARGVKGDEQRAVEIAQRAWQIEKTPEIAFNRALAYERSDRTADSIRAWQEYLALDPSSEWAVDAHKHLRDLQETN